MLTDTTFDEVVAASEVPVLVEFWAEWCPPCKVLGPVLDSIAAEYGDRLAFYKVNTEEDQALQTRFAISSVPTTLVFKEGVLVKRLVGARGKRHLLEELDGALS